MAQLGTRPRLASFSLRFIRPRRATLPGWRHLGGVGVTSVGLASPRWDWHGCPPAGAGLGLGTQGAPGRRGGARPRRRVGTRRSPSDGTARHARTRRLRQPRDEWGRGGETGGSWQGRTRGMGWGRGTVRGHAAAGTHRGRGHAGTGTRSRVLAGDTPGTRVCWGCTGTLRRAPVGVLCSPRRAGDTCTAAQTR